MMAQQQISPQQRMEMFATTTRQMIQTLPTALASDEDSTLQFNIPKARLLSKILIEVEAEAILKGSADGKIPVSHFSPYDILRRISLDLNNGFSPYVVSGREAYLYNLNRLNPNVLSPITNQRGMAYVENDKTTAGKVNKIKFMLELPITLNDRDTTGLILLQNAETNIVLTIDIDKLEQAYVKGAGDSITFKSLRITPSVETFSIPPIPEAFPDISVLKLVHSKANAFEGNGQSIIRMQVGTIYRKLVMYFEDENGVPLKDSDFNGNLEIVFNQADTPYSIKPSILSARNHSQLGYQLPDGIFIFDFSNQGIPNYGGSRDYIDTERLTEFWIRFNTAKKGKMLAVAETLSRLRA